MEKLYREVQLKHPRKIINGKIKRYSFFSWSGFFCCNKSEYLSLGQGNTSYFNTIKLLIIFFLIISLINIFLIQLFSQFTSAYDFKDDKLLKTTLGNTIIRYFNTTSITINKNETNYTMELPLDCGENIIDEIILIKRFYDVPEKFNYLGSRLTDLSVINEYNIYNNSVISGLCEGMDLLNFLIFLIHNYRNDSLFEIENWFYI